jgi:glycosyl transferase family 9 (putative heptosyltransferase)
VPYLPCAPAAAVRRPSHLRSIGLVWDVGNWDKRRCIPPQMLSALARTGVRLFSLQQGPARQMAAAIPAEDIAAPDIETLAATILRLDLIVTVDTMVAHLAGALGAPVCTLLHADCDWRWPLRDRETPWYPTMTLFHQQKRGDWTSVIEEVAEVIAASGVSSARREPRTNGRSSGGALQPLPEDPPRE